MCGGLFFISASGFTPSTSILCISVCTINTPRIFSARTNGKVSIVRAPMMVTRTGKRLCGSGKEGLDRAWGERSKSGAD